MDNQFCKILYFKLRIMCKVSIVVIHRQLVEAMGMR